MTTIQTTLDEVSRTIMKQITKVVADVASRHSVSDVPALTQDILTGLGLVTITEKQGSSVVSESGRKRVVSKKMKDAFMAVEGATDEKLKQAIKAYKDAVDPDSFESFSRQFIGAEVASVVSEGGRKRVVSKKMKETFMTLQGATEDKLKEAIKAYKEAAEVDSFDALSRQLLGLTLVEKSKKKEPKQKKEKSARFTPNTTSRKLFKTIVEESGGDIKTTTESELVAFIEALSDEDFASASIQGHMRAFIASKKPETTAAVVDKDDKDDDEDMEEFTFEDEKLLIGVVSGKIYQPTEEAGDVLIGHAGKGRFAKVKKPA